MKDLGSPVQVPVGKETLGRIFNVTGEVIDKGDPLPKGVETSSIHRESPKITEQNPEKNILETGIKVVDPHKLRDETRNAINELRRARAANLGYKPARPNRPAFISKSV